jgi:hypothetical protein
MKMVRYQDRPSAKELLKDEFFKDMKTPEPELDPTPNALQLKHKELLSVARKMKL